MRLGFIVFAALLCSTVCRTAHADSRSDQAWATPVVRVALLDGWHGKSTLKPMDLGVTRDKSQKHGAADRDPDPGALVTHAIQEVWSEVRAYRRPGGAEVVLRGKF